MQKIKTVHGIENRKWFPKKRGWSLARGYWCHTYSTYERGIDLMNTTYNFLDLTAKRRDENPNRPQDWVRYHDDYKST